MLEYWLWLTGRRGVGLRGLRALLEQFGTPEAVYCAAEQDYPQALRPEGRASLADKELAPARQILQQCYRKNIHVLTFQDAAYPNRLKNLDDAPLVLYYQGVFRKPTKAMILPYIGICVLSIHLRICFILIMAHFVFLGLRPKLTWL